MTLDPDNSVGQKDVLYLRVNANAVVEIIKNILTPKGWDNLMIQQHKFSFSDLNGQKSYDGPTMLKVLLEEVDPTSSFNVGLHCQVIKGAKLQD